MKWSKKAIALIQNDDRPIDEVARIWDLTRKQVENIRNWERVEISEEEIIRFQITGILGHPGESHATRIRQYGSQAYKRR